MTTPINWQQTRRVFVNDHFSIALVKVPGGYMEFDDYREDGGPVEKELPPYSIEFGTFTNAEISNMPYPTVADNTDPHDGFMYPPV